MSRAHVLISVAALVTASSAFGSVWYVDKDNAGAQDGQSWATAFTAVQPAIDAASDDGGGKVWVAEGVYDEARMSYPHGLDAGNTGSVIMKEGGHLYGGFAGTELCYTCSRRYAEMDRLRAYD